MPGPVSLVSATASGGSPVEIGVSGNPLYVTSGGSGATADQVQGNVASGTTDSGNPVKVGGTTSTTPQATAAGNRRDLELDPYGDVRAQIVTGAGTGIDGVLNTVLGTPNLNASHSVTIRPLVVANYVFNGTSWDRARGDLNGSWATPPSNYETVAASQTAQVLGATGATGDYIHKLVIIPATTSPGLVTILDNATSIPVWVGGTVGADLKPFVIELGMKSVSGAWKVTTGANVSAIGVGRFT